MNRRILPVCPVSNVVDNNGYQTCIHPQPSAGHRNTLSLALLEAADEPRTATELAERVTQSGSPVTHLRANTLVWRCVRLGHLVQGPRRTSGRSRKTFVLTDAGRQVLLAGRTQLTPLEARLLTLMTPDWQTTNDLATALAHCIGGEVKMRRTSCCLTLADLAKAGLADRRYGASRLTAAGKARLPDARLRLEGTP
ncbi:hypothetical protein EHF33_20570 (plasmid) [Deinococcus psychrotolerans]|uniref:Uncharacterized protein n=1 Tax=Deinococcus psychrotolerans TaxID=2489213 RepID=A0A3G8YVV2_9DEIO|nr:hypothetical protein [Deinococcus psychrotolerans]AZI45306.1 hypothetical protein EHF33_20570 [Deinococcus psychrotolerans]